MSCVRPPVNKINLVGKMARVMYKNILKNNSNNYYDNEFVIYMDIPARQPSEK